MAKKMLAGWLGLGATFGSVAALSLAVALSSAPAVYAYDLGDEDPSQLDDPLPPPPPPDDDDDDFDDDFWF